MKNSVAVSLLALVAATPALAQEATAQEQPATPAQPADQPMTDSEVDEIVVTAERIRGQVQTPSAPVLELDQQQVQAYGASSIADLVAQLAPAVGSGRGRGGRPVFLVNGQRITNFREIGRYPPEAINKVEVLPEEVALKFGYPADQRVINFILKDNFKSREVEAEYGMPTRGGYGAGELEVSQLAISGQNRLNLSADYQKSTLLTEADRGIVQTGQVPTAANDPDPAAYRSLVSPKENLELNMTSTSGLGENGTDGQLTLNGQWVHNLTRSFSGLDLQTLPSGDIRVIDTDPIERRTNTDTLSVGAGYNRNIGDYRFQATFDGGLTDTESMIDQRRTAPGPVITDLARTKAWTAGLKTTLTGNPVLLPAGEVSTTLNAAYDWDRIESFDTRTLTGNNTLTRGNLSASASASIPIASRRDEVLAALGDVTVNVAGGFENLSDFGTLGNYTAGLIWNPADPLTLQASYIVRQAAPGLSQLGGPTIVSFNVPVFDFRTGQSVLVTQTSGGNPSLRAETQRDIKLSASYDLDLFDRANILVEYYRNRSNDVTSSFPLLTPAIEAAFPGRITRDANGVLTALDVRPVTFSETRSERLRYGINLFGKMGKAQPQSGSEGGRGRMFSMVGRAMQQGSQATPPANGAEGAPAPVGTQATPNGRGTGGPGGFDPQRFAELRQKFCSTPEGQVPEISGIPAQMAERLKGDDGQIDPAKVAVMRSRFCSADGARRFDPARFAAMRQAMCADTGKDPDPATIPEEIRDRLKGPDGSIAPARLKEFRERICALPTGGQRGAGRGGEGGGTPPAGDDSGPPATSNRGREGGGGGGGRGGAGDGRGRWNVSLYHTINLASTVLVAPGGPSLDLLNGDATGSGGGLSRHQFELEGGLFYRGIGLRLSGNYSSPSTVRGTGLPGSADLRFGSLATFNLRAFVALDQQKWLVGEDPGFFKDARLSLRVNNLFDSRQRVTDANGVVPLRYQPFLIDPVGRFVEIEFRKLF
jgi:outer membrane receptor protein involved in Fe transport